jgi:hypothetical protein
MLTQGEQRERLLAAIAIIVMVAIAFSASYSGNSRSYRPLLPNAEVAEGPNDKPTDKDYLGLTTDEWIAGIQAFIFLLQLGAFSYQGYKLRQTVSFMNVQSTDMKASIAESVRAADAMESVSASLAENTATTKTIIENQRTYASIQMRAYLSIVTGACVPQDKTTNWRYEVRMFIKNTGHTTADAVNVISRLKIFDFPLPDNIDLALPTTLRDDAGHIAPGNSFFFPSVLGEMISGDEIEEIRRGNKRKMYIYGTVHYKDIFGLSHYTNFCQYCFWDVKDNFFTMNISRHNDAT